MEIIIKKGINNNKVWENKGGKSIECKWEYKIGEFNLVLKRSLKRMLVFFIEGWLFIEWIMLLILGLSWFYSFGNLNSLKRIVSYFTKFSSIVIIVEVVDYVIFF